MFLTITPSANANRYEIHRDVMAGFPDNYRERVLFRAVSGLVVVLSHLPPVYPASLKQSPFALAGGPAKFSLEANPTVKRQGRRHGLKTQVELSAWFTRKTTPEQSGLEFSGVLVGQAHPVKFGKMTFSRVEFSGQAQVVDPEKAARFIAQGIGSGKGLGFGLLVLETMI